MTLCYASDMTKMKCCTVCGVNKSCSEFYVQASSSDGLQRVCKVCQRNQRRDSRRRAMESKWEALRGVDIDPDEQWLPVVGYEGLYSISTMARVRSEERLIEKADGTTQLIHEQILKASPDGNGYWRVSLFRNNIGKTCYIHQMMMAAFVGPCPDGLEVRHLDGDKNRNRLDNFEYGTPSQNRFDTVRHGRNHNALKTECPQGHRYTKANTYWHKKPNGTYARHCRQCARDRAAP